MRKMGRKCRKAAAVLAAALCLCACFGMVYPAAGLTVNAQQTNGSQQNSGTQIIEMPGYVLEQWAVSKPMSVTKSYNVRVQPNTSAQKIGSLKAGTYVKAWGQTNTGWYFVEYGGTVAYVRYEAAVPIELMDAQSQAAALAAYQQYMGQAAAVPTAAQTNQAKSQQSSGQAQAAAIQAPQTAQASVVFIGDSRMVGMQEDLTEAVGQCPVTVVAQNGARHEWLESTGIPRADRVIGKGTKVLINLGVNDLGHVKEYLELVNAWAAVWISRGAQVYYASVNPVYANSHNMTEERVTVFNRELRAGLIPQITWIDSNSYLKQVGVKSNDGIHYQPITNLVLYQYYMAMIGMG